MNLQEAHKILELAPGISKDDVKKKYRELTKKYHPDINKEPGAEDRFKKINEAYSFIQSNNGNERNNSHPFKRQNNYYADHISLNTTISFKESVLGCEKHFKFNRKVKCHTCNGAAEIVISNDCDKCGGKGLIVTKQGNFVFTQTCDKCFGRVKTKQCDTCRCDGILDSDASVKVTIPGGVKSGNILQLSGMGHYVTSFMNMDQKTNVHIHIEVIPEEGLSLENNNVISELELDIIDAINGCKRTVKTILGNTEVEISPMSRNKDTVIIPNLGVGSIGNHVVSLNVKYSEKLINIVNELKGT